MAFAKPQLSFKPTYHTQNNDGSWNIGFAYTFFPHNYHLSWGHIFREGRQLVAAGQKVTWFDVEGIERKLMRGHLETVGSHSEYDNRVVTGKTSDAGLVTHNWIEKINPDTRTEHLVSAPNLGTKNLQPGEALVVSQLMTNLLNRI